MKRFAIGGVVLAIAGIGVLQSLPSKQHPGAQKPSPHVHAQAAPAQVRTEDAFSPMAEPRILRIPALSITGTVHPVGTTPEGAMDIPDSLADAGWYDQSARPGNPGKAVLAVHTGYPETPSQYRSLERVQVGAAIDIEDTTGATAHFSVIQIARYSVEKAPVATIFGESPTARLHIITCTGRWDPATQSYDERLVVYAARTH